MTHKEILDLDHYNSLSLQTHILLKHDPTFAVGDTFIASLKGHRDEREFLITGILKDKVNANFCYLLLKPVNQDDLKDVNVG